MTDLLAHMRRSTIPYAALLLVLVAGLGGRYARAASKTRSITVCADKKTGILHLKTRGKCKRGQTRVTWNQKGPQGPAGVPGCRVRRERSAVSVWANVTNAGSVLSGQGISVQHVGSGTYEVTITAPACAHGSNAPVVSVSDTNPPGGQATVRSRWRGIRRPARTSSSMVFTGYVPTPGTGGRYSGVTRPTIRSTCWTPACRPDAWRGAQDMCGSDGAALMVGSGGVRAGCRRGHPLGDRREHECGRERRLRRV